MYYRRFVYILKQVDIHACQFVWQLNISERHINTKEIIQITLYTCCNMSRNMPFKIYTENRYM